MKLNELINYQEIVLQCHDYPDADAIAAAFGVYQYLKSCHRKVRMVYSGLREISKSNLLLMLQELAIPLEYVKELNKPELLVTIDCQYKEGNVTLFDAHNIGIIDHHEDCNYDTPLKEICPAYASCATVVYAMLLEEGYDLTSDIRLSTALYYGLYMDSNSFSELRHPFDFDLLEDLRVDEGIMYRLKNSNFNLREMETAGAALTRYRYNESKRYALVSSEPCDPNIIGLISDLVLQVDCIDCCIVFCPQEDNYKMSVRSCQREIKASDLAIFLTEDIGNGGGHKNKAGGFIRGSKLRALYGDIPLEEYLTDRMTAYYESFDILDTRKDILDIKTLKKYQKLSVPTGYVKSTDIEGLQQELLIRTLEGDVTINVAEDIYIMIGINGEIYPIHEETLRKCYRLSEEAFTIHIDYSPKVKNRLTGQSIDFLSYAKTCYPTEHSCIYAKQLTKTTKVFSKWNYDSYMLGNVNDYIACKADDPQDIYVIKESVFLKTYKEVT